MRKLNCFLLAIAFTCSAGAVSALEMTANNEIRHLNSGLEQRLETTKSALTAAFNGLKGTIDEILARLGVLEAKMADVNTKQPVAWNTPLENRLKGIEATDAAQTTAINAATTKNVTQDNRLTALENKEGPSGVPVPNMSNCSIIETSATKDRMIMCPAGRVLVGLANSGLAVSSKNVYVRGQCCTLTLQ